MLVVVVVRGWGLGVSVVHLVRLRRPVVVHLGPHLLPPLQQTAHYFDLMRVDLPHVDRVVAEVVQERIGEDLADGQEACQPGAVQHAIVATGPAAAFAKPSFVPGGCGGGQHLAVVLEVVLGVEPRLADLLGVHDSHVLAVGQH